MEDTKGAAWSFRDVLTPSIEKKTKRNKSAPKIVQWLKVRR